MASDRFRVEGGNRLEGKVRISGNKNAAIHTMAATLLTPDDCYLENVPEIGDIHFMVEILRALGATVEYTSASSLRVNASGVDTLAAPSDLATHLRGSFLVMGPLLARFGEAACCPPGGDIIGLRPLNVHLDGFRTLSADISHEGDKFVARSQRLRGSRIFLDYPSVWVLRISFWLQLSLRGAQRSSTPRQSLRSNASSRCLEKWAPALRGLAAIRLKSKASANCTVRAIASFPTASKPAPLPSLPP